MSAKTSLGRSRKDGSRVAGDRLRGRTRRHLRLRKKISGSPARPRLVVHRSARHMVVQLVDDVAGRTLAAASIVEAGITAVVFDRGGYDYHGRIAALADAAREGGLEF